jgi:nitrogen fixation protein FixH
MKIHFSWGTGLLIFIILFIAALIGFFLFSSYQEFNLVEEDYYEREIGFQQHIDKTNRTEQLAEKITIQQDGKILKLQVPRSYPPDSVGGTLHFYRPSDSRLDVFIPFKPDTSGIQQVDMEKLRPGKYILKIDWRMDGLGYYDEYTLILK